jgi:hypothetical protein
MWSAPCPVLGIGPIDKHSENRNNVSYVVAPCAVLDSGPIYTHSDT